VRTGRPRPAFPAKDQALGVAKVETIRLRASLGNAQEQRRSGRRGADTRVCSAETHLGVLGHPGKRVDTSGRPGRQECLRHVASPANACALNSLALPSAKSMRGVSLRVTRDAKRPSRINLFPPRVFLTLCRSSTTRRRVPPKTNRIGEGRSWARADGLPPVALLRAESPRNGSGPFR